MDGITITAETQSASLSSIPENAPRQVFQPPKLHALMEVIDSMDTVTMRVREDSSHDLPIFAGTRQGQTGSAQTGTSARDDAIASAPVPAIMQQKLVRHLEREIKNTERQVSRIAKSNRRGSAFLLTELYRKIRRLTALITDILSASADMIKRFYISVFIDHQPMIVTGGSLARSEE